MTFRPARAAGMIAASALASALAATLGGAALAQEAPAAPEESIGGGFAPGQTRLIQPQAWPQCIVLIERSAELESGPEDPETVAKSFRDSLALLAAEQDIPQETLDDVFAQLEASVAMDADEDVVRSAQTCADAAPRPEMFTRQEG